MSNNTNKSNKNKQIYGYCRVSTKEQNLDRQLIAMREEGVQNWTFELLLECPKEELNEQERYFIKLYKSNEWGYNGTRGNK